MSYEIAKADWLYRKSTILHRWKKSWFVLYQDGVLKYFHDPNSHECVDAMLVRLECSYIRCGITVPKVVPPEDCSQSCLLEIVGKEGSWVLCADSVDDMRVWQIALEEARVMQPPRPMSAPTFTSTPPAYSELYNQQQILAYPYDGQIVYPSGSTHYVVQQPEGNRIVYLNQPYRCCRRRYDGSDVALGVAAGAMMGGLMWGPLFWC